MLNFKSFGSGEPIIILHGLFGTLDNWQSIAKRLAEQYLVYIVDQRNHGKSFHSDDFDYHLLSEDLRLFMEENWIHHTHLIGHGMGGKTAMKFSLEHPDMVESLIVVDIAPKQYPGGHRKIFEAMFSLQLDSTDSRSEIESQLAKQIESEAVRLFLMKNLQRIKEGGFRWKMNIDALFENYEQILSSIESTEQYDGPSLFIKGQQSSYIEDDSFESVHSLFPKASLEQIDDAGHWVHADQPDKFVEKCMTFLSENSQ